jgi:hypothetical protein
MTKIMVGRRSIQAFSGRRSIQAAIHPVVGERQLTPPSAAFKQAARKGTRQGDKISFFLGVINSW